MSKDVRRALQIAKHPLTQDVYHGTQAVFDRFRDSSKDRGEYTPSLMLGTHVARDPAISSNEYFTDRSGEQGGHVMPLKTYPDDKFFEIPQTKPNGTLEEDDKAVEQAIKLHAFKKHPEMLAHSLMMYHGLPVEKAAAAAHKLVAGGTYTSPGGETLNSLQALVNHWTLSPDYASPAARKQAVKSFRDHLIKQGYAGVKYQNTAPDETRDAKDKTNYIVFNKPTSEGYYPLRGRFAKFDPAEKASPDLMKAEGGAVDQEITSADTSIKQIPALFKSNVFEKRPGQRNLDIGGGKFDLGTQHLADNHGVESHVYDPFNRSEEHNASVLKKFARKKADSVTAANVLNVIQHPHHRKAVIQQAHDNLHPTGKAYFGIYEGNGSGKGAVTSKGWQNNRKAEGYMDEVREVFPHVERRGNIIVAHKRAPRAHGGATKEARQALMLAHGGVPPFKLHSGAAKLIGQKGQLKATPQQYAAMPGIKPDELKHANFDKLGTKALPREEMIKHLEANTIPLQETVLGGGDFHYGEADDPKYLQYTLPGGNNYREVLLHLPKQTTDDDLRGLRIKGTLALDKYNALKRRWSEMAAAEGSDTAAARLAKQNADRALDKYTAINNQLDEAKRKAAGENYKSSHWDQPNVVAHLRMSDRKGPNGEKILHVEEAQSDWGQEGRERGFKGQKSWNPDNIEKVVLPRMGDEPVWAYRHPETGHHIYPANSPAEVEEMLSDNESDKPPQGPYVDNTQKWTDLALKRVLHEAAHGGYDKVVFTPGEEQNKRYSLAAHVNQLFYDPDRHELQARERGTDRIKVFYDVSPDKLPGHIGKEAAAQLLAAPKNPNGQHDLDVKNLEVGGSGMRGFYDNILPKRLQALAQQHDPKAKVQLKSYRLPPKKKLQGYDTEPGDVLEHMGVPPLDWSVRWPAMSDDEKAQAHAAYENSGPVLHSLDVTPQMRDSIKQNGFSQFKRGGAVDENEGPIADWHWRPLDEVKDELQLHEIPSHVHKFGEFMDETARRATLHGLTPRDLIKAYVITRSSVGRRALDASTIRRPKSYPKYGFDELPADLGKVRPEGAMGHWLHTKMGQRYLDAAEAGRVDEEAVQHAIKSMGAFGLPENAEGKGLRWAAKNLPGREGRISELIARGYRGQSTPGEWRDEVNMPGIKAAKSGFLASMLGRGDAPTFDARQIILHTGLSTDDAAKRMSRKGQPEAAVSRLINRQNAMDVRHDPSMSPFYQHLLHHAVWDKTSGEETTHQDVIDAMRGAKNGGRQTYSRGGADRIEDPTNILGHPVARALIHEIGPHWVNPLDEAAQAAGMVPRDLAHKLRMRTGDKNDKLSKLAPQSDWAAHSVKIARGALDPIMPIDPHEIAKNKGTFIAGPGDRQITDAEIHGLNGIEFDTPVRGHGGPFYARGEAGRTGSAWASAQAPMKKQLDLAEGAERAGRTPYHVPWSMSRGAVDSTPMMWELIANLLPHAKINKTSRAMINRSIRGHVVDKDGTQPFRGAPSIDSAEFPKWVGAMDLGDRYALMTALEKTSHIVKGFPEPAALRLAITEPEYVAPRSLTAGRVLTQMDPKAGLIHEPEIPHPGYVKQVKKTGPVRGFERPVPLGLMFPTAWKNIAGDLDPEVKAVPNNINRAFQMGKISQPVTNEVADNIASFLEREKGKPFKKAGGSVVDRALAVAKKVTRA